MLKSTKLVDCKSKVFVYDFVSRKKVDKLGFEKGAKGTITNLERLLLTNFNEENRLSSVFSLKISLKEYNQAKDKLHSFITQLKNSTGR